MLALSGLVVFACVSFAAALEGGEHPDTTGNHSALSVVKFYFSDNPEKPLCMGVLLDPNQVLTTENCIRKNSGLKYMRAVIMIASAGMEYTVIYTQTINQFALLELAESVPTRNEVDGLTTDLFPVDDVEKSDEVFVVGLSDESEVRQIYGHVVSAKKCRQLYGDFKRKLDICVDLDTGYSDRLCKEDRGLVLWCMIDGKYRVCGMNNMKTRGCSSKSSSIFYFRTFDRRLRDRIYYDGMGASTNHSIDCSSYSSTVMYKLATGRSVSQFGMFNRRERDSDDFTDDPYCADNACAKHYRNRNIDHWAGKFHDWTYRRFLVTTYKNGGVAQYLKFNGTNPNPKLWFNETNFMNASYYDDPAGFKFTLNRWSLYSYVVEGANEVECYSGQLYLALVKRAGHCNWGLLQTPAYAYYNNRQVPSDISDTSNFDIADDFTIDFECGGVA